MNLNKKIGFCLFYEKFLGILTEAFAKLKLRERDGAVNITGLGDRTVVLVRMV